VIVSKVVIAEGFRYRKSRNKEEYWKNLYLK